MFFFRRILSFCWPDFVRTTEINLCSKFVVDHVAHCRRPVAAQGYDIPDFLKYFSVLGDYFNYIYGSIIDLYIGQKTNRIWKFLRVLNFGSIEWYKPSGELVFLKFVLFLLVRSTVSNMEALFNLQMPMTANYVGWFYFLLSGAGRTWPDLAGLGRTSENATLCLNFK